MRKLFLLQEKKIVVFNFISIKIMTSHDTLEKDNETQLGASARTRHL